MRIDLFTYDSRGLVLTTTDPALHEIRFTYDGLGRLLTTTDPLNRTTTLTYDAAGNVATSTDALNRVTTFQYDQKNRLTQVTDPLNGITQYTYDGNGNLLTVTDAKHQTTTFTYDDLNRLASTTDPLGKVEHYAYDGNDNLTKRITPKNETINFAYDAVNQLLSKTLPGSLVTSYTYDAVGNLLSVTDPDSALTMAYDLANRLTSVKTDGSPNQPAVTLTYGYDQTGNRVSLADPTQLTTMQYDRLNRLTAISLPPLTSPPLSTTGLLAAWLAEGTAQDAIGTQHGTLGGGTTFASGRVGQAFAFDGVDDYVTVPDSPVLDSLTTALSVELWLKPELGPTTLFRQALFARRDPNISESFELDFWTDGKLTVVVRTTAPGNPTSIWATPLGVVTFGTFQHVAATLDLSAGSLKAYVNGQEVPLTLIQGPGTLSGSLFSVNNLYLGRRQSGPTVPDGAHFQGSLDDIRLYSRARTASEVQASVAVTEARYAYDALSRRTSLTLPNGTQTTYNYDAGSQLSAISHQLSATSTQINKADYLYNNVGNRTSLTDRRGSQAFGYDALDRLTSASHPLLATPQAFSYDAVGNRTTAGNVTNVGNQLTADATHSYQYDDNGNLTRKTLLATGNYTQYTYDAENRLVKVEDFAAGNPTPAFTSTYRYDGLGRRIEKVGNGQTKRYIYDGEDILLEYDGANVLQARYTHGPGIDEPIAVTKGSATYFYHQDGLGSVTDLTDSAGATAKSYSYDAYGNILESPGIVDQPYTYTGREFDAESGLSYYRARYYDAASGRFLQKDAAGFSGGINFYAYVGANPTIFVDPFGLFSSPEGLLHYLGGSGSAVSVPFNDVDTSSVKATNFSQVKAAIGSCSPGTYPVNDVAKFSTGGDAALYLGHITLKMTGTVTVNCDCSWCFQGTLSAYPDVYDFNRSNHRTPAGEFSTLIGSFLPGKPYTINIVGSKPINQCSK